MTPSVQTGPAGSAVAVSSVTKVFGRRVQVPALRDVTLTIARGEMVAITGASGSGKSTLLNLIGGLDVPTSGRLEVFGTELSRLDEDGRARFRRRAIGHIFQAYHLLPTATAADNVALPLHLQRLPQTEITARVREALADVGLQDRAHHLPDELSGGECQRVAIARALITRPELVLADEPTGNLDSSTGAAVLARLETLHRDRAATLVIVTHDASVAARCQRVVRLLDGTVVEARP